MKIYFVLCDAQPFDDILFKNAKENNASILKQISNGFTTQTVLSALTGKLPSEIDVQNGIGYQTYKKEEIQNNSQPWFENNLINYLCKREDWEVNVHNSLWFKNFIFNNSKINYTSNFPPHGLASEQLAMKKKLGWSLAKNVLLGDNSNYQNNEITWIKKTQESPDNSKNQFHFIVYHYSHESIASNYMREEANRRQNELIFSWDFEEKDAVFIFFSDHGDWNKIDDLGLNPNTWMSWVLIKDNTSEKEIKRKIISSTELYQFINDKINNSDKSIFHIEDDLNKIYFYEDARSRIDNFKSTTAGAIKILKRNLNNQPVNEYLITTYSRYNKTFQSCVYNEFKKELKQCKVDENIANMISSKFKWVKS